MSDMSVADDQLRGGIQPSRLITYAGGVVSLALIAGGIFWGVNLVLRDVNGIPVVPAARAEMRVAPADPGGEVAVHAGFAVNSVAAEGAAAPVAERVRLAPENSGLTAEDLAPVPAAAPGIADPSAQVMAALDGAQAASSQPAAALGADASEADVLSLVDQIMAENGIEPMAPALSDDTDRVTVMVNGQPVQTRRSDIAPARAGIIPASVPGVVRALRPIARPASLRRPADPVAEALASTVAAATDTGVTVTAPGAIAPGTVLAQLGAFDSAELAVREWDRLSGLYATYFGDRARVIQRAETGGREFYRLRVSGFDDLSDSRRFCSAIKSGGATDCIPVVAR